MHRFEEEKRELEKRKRKALEEYHLKKKLSSSASSLDNSGPLPTSRKSSSDSHDIPLTQSPNQSRRVPVVDLENYQEADKIGSVSLTSSSNQELPSLPPLKRDPAADLEKKVRDALMAEWGESPPNHSHNQHETDMTLSTRNFTSPPGIRSPRHLISVQDLHAKLSHVHGSKAYHHPSHHHHHQKGAEGSPISPPPPTRSPVPRSPTMPAASFTLPTSPPPAPQQPIWMSRSHPQHPSYHTQPQPHHQVHQHHHIVTSTASTGMTTAPKGVPHSDSGEWTEFTSAPCNVVGQESTLAPPSGVAVSHSTFSEGFPASHSTPALGTLMSCGSGGSLITGSGGGQHQQPLHQKVGADLSEFDPIAVSTSGGSIPSELHQNQPPFKHRT